MKVLKQHTTMMFKLQGFFGANSFYHGVHIGITLSSGVEGHHCRPLSSSPISDKFGLVIELTCDFFFGNMVTLFLFLGLVVLWVLYLSNLFTDFKFQNMFTTKGI